MISKKLLKEEILTFDVIKHINESGKITEYIEVVLTDRIIEVYMDTKEVNIGLIVNKIIEENLYK